MIYRTHQSIIDQAVQIGKKRFAVAGAESETLLQAVCQAYEMGIAEPVLIGNPVEIARIATANSLHIDSLEIISVDSPEKAVETAVRLVSRGEADVLMKGLVSTKIFLHTVLKPEYGFRASDYLSHIAMIETPGYDKMILITDGGMNIRPDLKEKIDILKNAIRMMHALDIPQPKVAVLTAVEKVDEKMPETADASALAELSRKGEFGDAIVEGPVSLDIAVSQRSAAIKGYQGKISGETDIFLVPDITSGNLLAKGLLYLGGGKSSGLILGAAKPIVMLSRSDTVESRLNSIALSHVVSQHSAR